MNEIFGDGGVDIAARVAGGNTKLAMKSKVGALRKQADDDAAADAEADGQAPSSSPMPVDLSSNTGRSDLVDVGGPYSEAHGRNVSATVTPSPMREPPHVPHKQLLTKVDE